MAFRTATATAVALIALGAGPVLAQNVFTGVEDVEDRIEDIQEETEEDLGAEDRDRFRFGVQQGWSGSFSLSADATTGNTETLDVTAAGRLTYGAGRFTNFVGFGVVYGESDDVQDEGEAFVTYDGIYDFGNRFYVFGTGRYEYDDFGTFEHDAFVGAGPGYRVFAEENLTWRVQAGPGIRYLEDQAGNDTTEAAGILSSRFYYEFNDMTSLTNDTDVIGSEESVQVSNDLGVNFRMTDVLSTRVSLNTDWTDDPAPGFDEFDNSIGLAVVYSF